MIEKTISIILLPILVYLFGYYLPKYMINSVNTTFRHLLFYFIASSIVCIVFMYRRKKPEEIHQFFLWLTYSGTCLLGGLLITEITNPYEHTGIALACMAYVYYFVRITRTTYHRSKFLKSSLIMHSIIALIAVAASVPIISNLMHGYEEIIILLPCLFFVGGILYPLNILFSMLYKDNHKEQRALDE